MGLALSGTTWAPLGPQTEVLMQGHDVICLHTMVGTLAGTDQYFRNNGYGGTESHFGIGGSGITLQWQDLMREADANYEGNPYVISIETADKGEGFFPIWTGSNVPAWTTAQVNKIVSMLDAMCKPSFHAGCPSSWTCHTYGIPRVLIPDTKPGRRGIAYHRQGINPWRVTGGDQWSLANGKVCPGDRRIEQLTKVIIPRVIALDVPNLPLPPPITGSDDDMQPMTVVTKKSNPNDVFLVWGMFRQYITTIEVMNIYLYLLAQKAPIPIDDDWFNSLVDVKTLVK